MMNWKIKSWTHWCYSKLRSILWCAFHSPMKLIPSINSRGGCCKTRNFFFIRILVLDAGGWIVGCWDIRSTWLTLEGVVLLPFKRLVAEEDKSHWSWSLFPSSSVSWRNPGFCWAQSCPKLPIRWWHVTYLFIVFFATRLSEDCFLE